MLRILRYPVLRNNILITSKRCGSNLETTVVEQEVIEPDKLDLIESHKMCVAQVKKYDRENYLAGLCIEDALTRRLVFTLRAFNVELSLVRDSTTNSDRAKLRFHFWSQLIEEIIRRDKEAYPSNDAKLKSYYNYTPVAKELLDIFHLVDLDQELEQMLKDLIGARVSSKVLGYKPFKTIDELELYCAKANSSLYNLSWILSRQLHNVWHSNYDITPQIKLVADSMGVAHGLSNVIRGIVYNSTKNCCYIPEDILDEHHMTSRDFVGKNFDSIKVAPIVKVLASRCQKHVTQAYLDQRYIPNFFRQIFLPRVAIQDNLNCLRRCNYNLNDSRMKKRNNLLPLDLWMASKYFRAPILRLPY